MESFDKISLGQCLCSELSHYCFAFAAEINIEHMLNALTNTDTCCKCPEKVWHEGHNVHNNLLRRGVKMGILNPRRSKGPQFSCTFQHIFAFVVIFFPCVLAPRYQEGRPTMFGRPSMALTARGPLFATMAAAPQPLCGLLITGFDCHARSRRHVRCGRAKQHTCRRDRARQWDTVTKHGGTTLLVAGVKTKENDHKKCMVANRGPGAVRAM